MKAVAGMAGWYEKLPQVGLDQYRCMGGGSPWMFICDPDISAMDWASVWAWSWDFDPAGADAVSAPAGSMLLAVGSACSQGHRAVLLFSAGIVSTIGLWQPQATHCCSLTYQSWGLVWMIFLTPPPPIKIYLDPLDW